MFCTKCGANNPDSGAYCMKCGAPLAGQTLSGAAALAKVEAALAAPPAAARRVGAEFVVPREGATLPPNCVQCGQPTRQTILRTYSWHEPWLYLLIFCGLLIYVVLALALSKRATLNLPLCEEHLQGYRTKRKVGGIMMLVAIPFMIAMTFTSNDTAIGLGVLVGIGLLLGGAVVFTLSQTIRPTRIDETSATFKGAGEAFLQLLPS